MENVRVAGEVQVPAREFRPLLNPDQSAGIKVLVIEAAAHAGSRFLGSRARGGTCTCCCAAQVSTCCTAASSSVRSRRRGIEFTIDIYIFNFFYSLQIQVVSRRKHRILAHGDAAGKVNIGQGNGAGQGTLGILVPQGLGRSRYVGVVRGFLKGGSTVDGFRGAGKQALHIVCHIRASRLHCGQQVGRLSQYVRRRAGKVSQLLPGAFLVDAFGSDVGCCTVKLILVSR